MVCYSFQSAKRCAILIGTLSMTSNGHLACLGRVAKVQCMGTGLIDQVV